MLVLDSGGLSRLSERTRRAAALITALRDQGLWPPVVPTVVLAESTAGRSRTDANVNRLVRSCDVDPTVTEATADEQASSERGRDVAQQSTPSWSQLAEPGGTVMTSDRGDLGALATYADDVEIEVV